MLDERIQNCAICRGGGNIFYDEIETVIPTIYPETTDLAEQAPSPVKVKRHRIDYAFTGDIRKITDGSLLHTGDFAPLFEAGPNVIHEFHTKMDQDQGFREAQIEANRRMSQFDKQQQEEHDRMRTHNLFDPGSITTATGSATTANTFTVPFNTNGTDITAWDVRITTNTGTAVDYNQRWGRFTGNQFTDNTTAAGAVRFNIREGFGAGAETANWFTEQYQRDVHLEILGDGKNIRYEVRNALMKVFTKVPKRIRKNMTEDEKKMFKAKQTSEKLLKEWLSPGEYQGLKIAGEVPIRDKEDPDIIYIIKKDPNAQVKVLKQGIHIENWCVVAEDLYSPVGDQLLSKFMQLKHDQKGFKKLAVKSKVF